MTLPRYPEYKDSGVEWLGEVPAHWRVVPLARVTRSRCDGPFGSGLKSEHYAESGVRVVRLQNIRREGFDGTDEAFVDLDYYQAQLLGHDVVAGDVLIAGLGDDNNTVGRACVAPKGIEPAMVKADCFRFRLNQDEVRADFVAVALTATAAVDAGRLSTGSTRARIPLSIMAARKLLLPPLDEQAHIADFLDRESAKIDALVAEQQRLIELLKEKRQAVISHAVTKGLNPNAPMKDSGIEWLGEVPDHWEVVALKRVAHVNTGVAKGRDIVGKSTIAVPYLRVANVQDGFLDLDDVATIEIGEDEIDRYALKPGDVLMNEGGDFDKLGRGCVWHGEISPCITQNHVFAVRPCRVESAWLNLVSSSAYAQFYFMMRSKQSTNLASISSTNLMELAVPLPPSSEQLEIVSHVERDAQGVDALVAEASRAIDLLTERRTALISAAVTGQIDVRPRSMRRTA